MRYLDAARLKAGAHYTGIRQKREIFLLKTRLQASLPKALDSRLKRFTSNNTSSLDLGHVAGRIALISDCNE